MIDYLAEIQRLLALCRNYELQWHRATAGAASANKAIRRLQAKCHRLEETNRLLSAEVDKLRHEAHETEKKVARLSLRIIELWGDR
jgi:predicted nuclease with TOPRIM domain